ncbi:hypothetical protein L9F63_000153 [Diploptera punctata]|uniref:Uncharacterized protein n=1 Tax=Diploptera punctata TaxID=6984 RepID=A0AAD8ANU7_DIPPU|nr:hypothetical protein L9F63_000153 [Diploptera punctata]
MENISVPSHVEFQHEISQRPSELDTAEKSQAIPQQKIAAKLPDLISTEEGGDMNPFLPPGAICGKSVQNLENGSFKDFLDQGDRNFQEFQCNLQASGGGLALDESEVSSTKAEFGDDSNLSYMTSELQKTITESVSSFATMEKSLVEQEVLESELTPDITGSDINELKFNDNEFGKDTTTDDSFQEGDSMIVKNTHDEIHVSFEIQKELVPEMESKPERIQLESEGTSSIDQDESSSPVQTDSKLQVFDDDISTDLKLSVHEEEHLSSKIEVSNTEQSELPLPDVDNVCLSPKPSQDEQISPDSSKLSALQIEDDGLSPISQLSPKPSHSPPHSPILSDKSLESPPQSPILSKPELSPLQSQDLETSPKSPLLTQEPQSPSKSPMLEQLESSEKIETPQSPVLSKSPIWEVSSPVASAVDTALSTPETVPIGKDEESPSPLLENKSPTDLLLPLEEPVLQTSQEKVVDEVENLFEVSYDNKEPPIVNKSDFEISDLEPPSNRLPTDLKLEENQVEISSDVLVKPVEDDSAMQVPPPTPAFVSENVLAEEAINSQTLVEKLDLSTEKVDVVSEKKDLETEKAEEKKDETNETIAAAAAAGIVAGTVAAAIGVVKATEEKPSEKKTLTDAKKTTPPVKKGPVAADKTKTN